jgi:hypothetical protein
MIIGIAASQECNAARQRIAPGDMRVTLSACAMPLNAGTISTVAFTPLVTAHDTNYTSISIVNVVFYSSGAIQGSGCTAAVTVVPLCGMKGVYYYGPASLAQNYPNPFTGKTTIHVTLAQGDMPGARLTVYNMLGNTIADLTAQLRPDADIAFDAGGLSQGVYYYVLETPSGRLVKQMFVIK